MSISVYSADNEQEFYNYIDSQEKDLIYSMNNWDEQINDIIKICIKNNRADLATIIEDIEMHNYSIFENMSIKAYELGQLKEYYSSSDEYEEIISCLIDEFFLDYLGNDVLTVMENMVYEVVSKYEHNIVIHSSSLGDYPVFLRRFSESNWVIENININNNDPLIVECYHAQQPMFFDLYEEIGCCFYGKKNVLLIDNKNITSNKTYGIEEGVRG